MRDANWRGLFVAELVNEAHVPDQAVAPTETVALCWRCHRAYDKGLLADAEIEAVRDRWLGGQSPPYAHEDLVRT